MTDDAAADTDIRKLDETTVERIAAGEVVERPASAVKELVENAVDADAGRIEVAVDGDGTERIRVHDDGVGMSEADLRAAVRAHTTSKLDGPEDLESGFATLGFRGEALHTVGAVSRLRLCSRPRGGDAGTELVYEGGEVRSVEPCGCPEGTTVVVEDLFYNTPARREYLNTEATEFAHVTRTVRSYALANPDVAVSLAHDGRETFATDGQGSLRSAVMAVYGREVAEAMIPVDATADPAAPLDAVTGLVSHPETNRSTAEYCSTFVNGRYVESDTVREAVLDAYGGQLAGDRYPFAVLNLDLDPATVDVNVHPRKMEVRFESAEAVREQVKRAVREALVDEGLVRTSAPRGTSKAAETAVEPELAGESDGGRAADRPPAEDGGSNASRSATGSRPAERESAASAARDAASGSGSESRPAADPTTGDGADASATPTTRDGGGQTTPDSGTAERPSGGTDVDRATSDESIDGTAKRSAAGGGPATDRTAHRHEGADRQRTLTGEPVDASPDLTTLPSLRVLGQFDDTYLVCEGPEGLLVVDQHAADERVNYERLRAELTGETTAQELAEPVELSVTAGEAATLSAHGEALERLGFRADLADDRTVRVSAVPAAFSETLPPETLRDVLAAFVGGESEGTSEGVADLADDLLADLACHPSITGNTSLTEGSALDLLAALDDCENPYACPHGRPVIVSLDREEIDARFERDYPGHG